MEPGLHSHLEATDSAQAADPPCINHPMTNALSSQGELDLEASTGLVLGVLNHLLGYWEDGEAQPWVLLTLFLSAFLSLNSHSVSLNSNSAS